MLEFPEILVGDVDAPAVVAAFFLGEDLTAPAAADAAEGEALAVTGAADAAGGEPPAGNMR